MSQLLAHEFNNEPDYLERTIKFNTFVGNLVDRNPQEMLPIIKLMKQIVTNIVRKPEATINGGNARFKKLINFNKESFKLNELMGLKVVTVIDHVPQYKYVQPLDAKNHKIRMEQLKYLENYLKQINEWKKKNPDPMTKKRKTEKEKKELVDGFFDDRREYLTKKGFLLDPPPPQRLNLRDLQKQLGKHKEHLDSH